ncbi:NAD(P)-dependent oxidoreductase [Oceanobacter mangrovi]|uniref:NAD(P)-dependent oxidoreductase n=1 Tax=Oceanobacter mangrovi TaxID=2862510 RepID=UPI001C8D5A17|nr:NAD(P)-dependent oxidoreductase [Oceanobacter mangrovi]
MKIALFGGTGRVGSRLLKEAVARGHQVTAFSRDISVVENLAGVTWRTGDLHLPEQLPALLSGHDVILTAVHFTDVPATTFLQLCRAARIPRLLSTGGAGSLLTNDGKRLMDSAEFPPHVIPEATAGARFLEILKQEKEIDWVFLSPSMLILPGERTGQFRLGTDNLLIDSNGKSHISMEDFAVAMLDELEQPQHRSERFTVGY